MDGVEREKVGVGSECNNMVHVEQGPTGGIRVTITLEIQEAGHPTL
jgi:hypothetical protein